MISKTLTLYKNAYSGLSRETWWLSAAMLVNRSGTMVMPFLTLYLTRPAIGFSLSKAGTVLGLYGLGALTGAHFGGKLTDRIGFFKVQLTALVGGGLLFLLLGQMKTYPTICITTFLLSMVNESFRPANSTAIAHYSAEGKRTRSYALNRLAINLGWAFGTAMGGLIASFNYEWLFWLDGCTNLLAALLLWRSLQHTRESIPKKEKHLSLSQSAYSDSHYLWFCLFITLFACCFFQLFTNLPAYYRNELKFNEKWIGLLGAVNGLTITFFEMVIIFRLEGKRSNSFFITRGVFLCALGYVSMLFLPPYFTGALLMMLIMTTGEIIAIPFMNAWWMSRSTADNRGSYAALYNMSWSLAQSVGPWLGALLASALGFRSLWAVAALVMALSATGFFWLGKFKKQTPIASL